jgi:hypothetical protein
VVAYQISEVQCVTFTDHWVGSVQLAEDGTFGQNDLQGEFFNLKPINKLGTILGRARLFEWKHHSTLDVEFSR